MTIWKKPTWWAAWRNRSRKSGAKEPSAVRMVDRSRTGMSNGAPVVVESSESAEVMEPVNDAGRRTYFYVALRYPG
ncbi:hypothetical protein GCM10009791_16230 [Citricoccus zhacaiensis]